MCLCLAAFYRRYTGVLAESAAYVKSIDFIEKFIEKNREINAPAHPNIDFICADVMQLELEDSSFDLVFSNWLLMYLDDAEVDQLVKRMLR